MSPGAITRWIDPMQLLRDFAGVMLLAGIAILAGIGINRTRPHPIPLTYQSPAQRLQAQLATLVTQVSSTPVEIDEVSLADLRSQVAQKSVLVLDARPAEFYRMGHVPGALNLSREDFAADYARLHTVLASAKDRNVVVYCSGEDCKDSKMVANALVMLGFARVKIFKGGWPGWQEAGLPAEVGPER